MTQAPPPIVTESLDENAAARTAGFETAFVLGRTNGLRDVVFCAIPSRPTYVVMDVSALEVAARLPIASGTPLAEITPRGRPRLHRPRHAQPQEVLQSLVSTAWRWRDRRSILLTARPDLWRDVERELWADWHRWAVKTRK